MKRTKPSDYGLKHPSFRVGQHEAIEWVLEKEGIRILEAPTGSGKTAIASATGIDGKLFAFAETKLLQDNVYGDEEFFVLKGRNNYPCYHPDARSSEKGVSLSGTAEDCPNRASKKTKCLSSCPYPSEKAQAVQADKLSLNYALYTVDPIWRTKRPKTMVLDEAHRLSEIVLRIAGIQVHERHIENWNLPQLPMIRSGGLFEVGKDATSEEQVYDWLKKSAGVLGKEMDRLEREISKKKLRKDVKRWRSCRNFFLKVSSTMRALEESHSNWYIRREDIWNRGKKLDGITIKPLTARHYFGKYFSNADRILLMSATIGKPDIFAEELGIEEFEFHQVDNQWKPEHRPVYVLDCPPMGKAKTDKNPRYWDMQADEIAKLIKKYPGHWKGILHTQSKKKGYDLARRLGNRGLASRVWVVPEKGTDLQMEAWEERKRKVPNSLCVSWSFHEGVDLWDEEINIDTGIAFANIGDPYEFARMRFDGKFYRQRAAWTTMQKSGRNRRGHPDHYNTNGRETRVVAIADGNLKGIRNYLSQGYVDSLVYL